MITQTFETTRDHLTIRGLILSQGADEKRPAVILSHGFLCNYEMCMKYATVLASEGFVSLVFDFCGGGPASMSDGATTDMTVFTEVEDLKAVLTYAQSLPFVDSEHISLLGLSQGGFVSALTAAQLPDSIESLVLMYPALCIPDDARRGNMQVAAFDPQNIPDTFPCGPMMLGSCYPSCVLDVDAFDAISGYGGPVLLLHGTEDTLVDISYSRKAKDCYPNCEYHEIEGAGHVFMEEGDVLPTKLLTRFMTLIRDFEFRSVLPGEAEAVTEIEQICFPPHEACSAKDMHERVEQCPELFLVAIDRKTGKIAGFLNGISTNETKFRDEFFTDISLFEPSGSHVMLLGLDVLPEYRSRGLARMIVNQYIGTERKNGRSALVLTCLDSKIPMYLDFGFEDLGISASVWGGEEWHDMRFSLLSSER